MGGPFAMVGFSELLLIFAVIGGITDANPKSLKAPYDSGDKAIRYVLPDGHLYVHANLEGSLKNVSNVLDELAGLKAVDLVPDAGESISRMQKELAEVLSKMEGEANLDFTKDVGTVTISLSMASMENISFMVRLRGRFKGSKLKTQMAKEAESTYTFKGKEVYRMSMGTPMIGGQMVSCLPDDTTLLIGPATLVEEALAKGRIKAGKDGALKRLQKLVNRKTSSFIYLSVPDWILAFAGNEPGLATVAPLLGSVDYLFVSTGARKGDVVIGVSDGEQLAQVGHLLQASAALINTIPNLVDAAAHGVLGVLPYVPADAMPEELRLVLADEVAVMEAAKWFKKRFTGKATSKMDKRGQRVTLSTNNPAALGGALLPVLAGAGYWSMSAAKQEVFKEEAYPEKLPDRRPAIEHLPMN